jgi:carbonic anhydrase
MVKLARRDMLKSLAITGALCPVCAALWPAAGLAQDAAHPAQHWSYAGEGGPENWGMLSPEFRVCALGFEQTPIDLTGGIKSQLSGILPIFRPMPLRILNNGHTIQVNCAEGSGSYIDGRRFDLVQFHFHHPSEHLLDGRNFDLELHFVHRSPEGQLAVLGVFIQAGAENPALAPIWAAMPATQTPETEIGTEILPGALLPAERGFFRYQGSLTTPPCSEGVLWSVFRQPIEASAEQIRQFAEIFPVNARPVQPRHRRFLLDSL